jgi:hypothetical protein
MLPSPVAVRFGSSQQLIWVIGCSAHRFWGERKRGGDQKRGDKARQFAGRASERSRKIHTAITTRG